MSGSPRARRILTALAFATLVAAGCGVTESPVIGSSPIHVSDALAYRDGAPSISIIRPSNNTTVISPVLIQVGTENLSLSPSGETRDGEGHLHVMVNQDCRNAGVVILSGAQVVDLTDGRAEVSLDLDPGRYELCVQVGDGFHTAVEIVDTVSFTVLNWAEFGSGLGGGDEDEVTVREGPEPSS